MGKDEVMSSWPEGEGKQAWKLDDNLGNEKS
jgi:hypothetical protein